MTQEVKRGASYGVLYGVPYGPYDSHTARMVVWRSRGNKAMGSHGFHTARMEYHTTRMGPNVGFWHFYMFLTIWLVRFLCQWLLNMFITCIWCLWIWKMNMMDMINDDENPDTRWLFSMEICLNIMICPVNITLDSVPSNDIFCKDYNYHDMSIFTHGVHLFAWLVFIWYDHVIVQFAGLSWHAVLVFEDAVRPEALPPVDPLQL
jgi:hypothetical protein